MDISALIGMAEASRRETFITDSDFSILWTNSDRDLTKLLMKHARQAVTRRPDKEELVRCGDRSLRILPMVIDGERVFLFELIDPTFTAELFSKSPAVEAFKTRLNASMSRYTDLLFAAVAKAPDLIDRLSAIRVDDANASALLGMLTDSETEIILDVGEHIEHLAGRILKTMFLSSAVRCEFDIRKGIIGIVDRSDLDYAVINMVSNAVRHAEPVGLTVVKLSVRADDEFIIIEVADNGTKADLEHINSFADLYPADEKVTAFSGLGIAMINAFAKKYGGTAVTSLTETGGLRMTVSIKRPKERNLVTLYSSETDDTNDPPLEMLMADLARHIINKE